MKKSLMPHDKLDKFLIGVIIFCLIMAVIVLILGDNPLRIKW